MHLSGIFAGLLSLSLPETNGHAIMETIKEAETFYEHKRKERNSHK